MTRLNLYERRGHFGHVTWTIYTNLRSPFHRRHHIKLALNGQAVSEKNIFNQSMTNGPLNAHLILSRYNHSNEKQEALS